MILSMQAQNYNTLREKLVFINSDTILIDSLSIIPGTVKISFDNSFISKNNYRIDYSKALLFIDDSFINRTLKFKYRCFDVNFTTPYFHKD